MRIVMFYHSLLSCWNHGNAHFLRGVAGELARRGHDVAIYEPRYGWSLGNLLAEHGTAAIAGFAACYPLLDARFYDPEELDLDEALDGADLVIAHEWNDPALIGRLGEHRARNGYRLLLHDTHHRAVTAPEALAAFDLRHFDGVLAFGEVIRRLYLERGWARRAWTWHEAADTRVFRPRHDELCEGDLVWIGNWGDEERSDELREYLLEPSLTLGLRACAYGVRYPDHALRALASAGVEYRGWLPNHRVPHVLSRFRVTVHVPRGPYARALPGVPTIRLFEALACEIPLITSPWQDCEGLFEAGRDYLLARDGQEMTRLLREVLEDQALARYLAAHGRRTILARHTCAHRVDELFEICRELGVDTAAAGHPRAMPAGAAAALLSASVAGGATGDAA